MMVYNSIVDSIMQNKKNSMAGQMSLFDIATDDVKEEFEIKLPNVSEYRKSELLAFEKEVIGVYISGHPLEEYMTKWKKNITNTSADFVAKDDEEEESKLHDGDRISVGGMITAISIKSSKTNQMMAFVTIEDIYGTMEVIVFAKVYERFRTAIVMDEKVFVRGRININESDGAKVICDTITSFENTPSQLWLRFENKEQYTALADEIDDICRESDGNDNVVIYLKEEKQKKILPPSKNVKADGELQEKLKEIIGSDNVVVV